MWAHWTPRIALIAIAVAIVWTIIVMARYYSGAMAVLFVLSVGILLIVVKGRAEPP